VSVDTCLIDTGCLAWTVAGICAGIAAAKRLYEADQWRGIEWLLVGVRRTASGAVIQGSTSAALCVLAVEAGGVPAKAAACLAVLASVAVDWASPTARGWLTRYLSRIAGHPPSDPPPSS
jgi:hypothetical protein